MADYLQQICKQNNILYTLYNNKDKDVRIVVSVLKYFIVYKKYFEL